MVRDWPIGMGRQVPQWESSLVRGQECLGGMFHSVKRSASRAMIWLAACANTVHVGCRKSEAHRCRKRCWAGAVHADGGLFLAVCQREMLRGCLTRSRRINQYIQYSRGGLDKRPPSRARGAGSEAAIPTGRVSSRAFNSHCTTLAGFWVALEGGTCERRHGEAPSTRYKYRGYAAVRHSLKAGETGRRRPPNSHPPILA